MTQWKDSADRKLVLFCVQAYLQGPFICGVGIRTAPIMEAEYLVTERGWKHEILL